MAERAVLTVSQLTDQLRAVVEEQFPAVWVEGEISNFRVYGSGHAYFTLKDETAQVRGVLFRNRMRRIRFEPGDGQHVLAFGSLEVYATRGEYQLVVELLEPRGLGALQLAFEQLKARLGAEGLFAESRKRSLPRFPQADRHRDVPERGGGPGYPARDRPPLRGPVDRDRARPGAG